MSKAFNNFDQNQNNNNNNLPTSPSSPSSFCSSSTKLNLNNNSFNNTYYNDPSKPSSNLGGGDNSEVDETIDPKDLVGGVDDDDVEEDVCKLRQNLTLAELVAIHNKGRPNPVHRRRTASIQLINNFFLNNNINSNEQLQQHLLQQQQQQQQYNHQSIPISPSAQDDLGLVVYDPRSGTKIPIRTLNPRGGGGGGGDLSGSALAGVGGVGYDSGFPAKTANGIHQSNPPNNFQPINLNTFSIKPQNINNDPSNPNNNNNNTHHQNDLNFEQNQSNFLNLRPGQDKTQAQLAWLGYQQELHRDWGFWSSLSLSTLNIGTIPGAFFGLMTSITWGGPCVQFWGYLLGMMVMLCLSGVIAEIASAFPIAGAMMTWTFKLARSNPRLRDWARFLSWTIGTMLFFAHVVIQVALTSQCTSMVISTLSRFHHHLIIQPGWQTFLMNSTYLIICGTLLCSNLIRSPKLWIYIGCFSIFLLITISVSLLTFSNYRLKFPKYLNEFENHTDFDSNVFVFFMGSSLISLAFGAEASIHLSEETCEPSSNVPKALFGSTLLSYCLGLFVNLCISATLPPMKDVPLSKIRLVDLIFSHCPRPVSILIMSCLIILMIFQDIAQLFAASRFTWAMARENVFPGSKVWRKVSGSHRMPRMAIMLLVGCCILTAATIDIKDTIFSHSVITSATYLVVVCYLAPLLIYLTCERNVLEYDGRNVWRIRGLSRPCAWISVFSLTCVLILMAFPTGLPITSETWSWSPLILISLTIISTLTWITYGSERYVGPIKSITFWTTGQELDIPIRKFPTPNPPAIVSTLISPHRLFRQFSHHRQETEGGDEFEGEEEEDDEGGGGGEMDYEENKSGGRRRGRRMRRFNNKRLDDLKMQQRSDIIDSSNEYDHNIRSEHLREYYGEGNEYKGEDIQNGIESNQTTTEKSNNGMMGRKMTMIRFGKRTTRRLIGSEGEKGNVSNSKLFSTNSITNSLKFGPRRSVNSTSNPSFSNQNDNRDYTEVGDSKKVLKSNGNNQNNNHCSSSSSNNNNNNNNNRAIVWPINVTTTTITEICGSESIEGSIIIEDNKGLEEK